MNHLQKQKSNLLDLVNPFIRFIKCIRKNHKWYQMATFNITSYDGL